MSLFQTQKPKSASKVIVPPSKQLDDAVVETLEIIAQMAGATLGPGGRQVLIERQEMGMKPIMTKDGVTVVKNLGFKSAIKQLVLEAARDAAIRTASEAGDGTTTATILSASIAKQTAEIVRQNPKLSPQKIVREMQSLVPVIEMFIKKEAIDLSQNTEEILLNVAKLSANGDSELAQKIIEAMNLVGDEGNLTIVEHQGESKTEIERIKGYAVEVGYEESCRNFANGFVNDRSGTAVLVDDPVFVLYDGILGDINQSVDFFNRIGNCFIAQNQRGRAVVFVCHGFAESVIGELYNNWNHVNTPIRVFPLLTPQKAIMNWRTQFLHDLQAYTGATVFNPLDKPLVDADIEKIIKDSRVKHFECQRFTSNIIAEEDQEAIDIRVDELKNTVPESQLEDHDIKIRIGKLTSGIARLNIYGSSAIETRERRDRAEDAWMALKGTIKHGACPGGGYVLIKLAGQLMISGGKLNAGEATKLAIQILAGALLKPVDMLYENYGYVKSEIEKQKIVMLKNDEETFDILEQKWVPKNELLDSVPAVVEAIRNAISIASLFGTIGGIIAFERDRDTDKEEEAFVRRFESAIGERG